MKMMEIVHVEEIKVEALQVKSTVIDWEIHTEGSRKYWKIIRVSNITKAYQSFKDMLKGFDKEDLDTLWSLVKERFRSAEPTKDMERALWVKLKRLFKPDKEDTLWKLQRYMHDPLTWTFLRAYILHSLGPVAIVVQMNQGSPHTGYPVFEELPDIGITGVFWIPEQRTALDVDDPVCAASPYRPAISRQHYLAMRSHSQPPLPDFIPEPIYPEYMPQEDEVFLDDDEDPERGLSMILPQRRCPRAMTRMSHQRYDEDIEDDVRLTSRPMRSRQEEEHPYPADSVGYVARLLAISTLPSSPLSPWSSPLPQIPLPTTTLDSLTTTTYSKERKLIHMRKIHDDNNVADLLAKAFDKGIRVNAGDSKLMLLGINLLLLEKVNVARHNLLLLVLKVNAVRHNLQLLANVNAVEAINGFDVPLPVAVCSGIDNSSSKNMLSTDLSSLYQELFDLGLANSSPRSK
ncbi:hypothetical protein Tco_1115461, partial [Tanacetum coccineum]